MIKILYLVSTLKRSGPIKVLLNLVSHLERDYVCPVIVTLSNEEENSMLSDFESVGIPVESLSLSKLQSLMKGRAVLARLLGDLMPTVVHSHGLRADVLMASMQCPWLRVCTLHNYPYYDYLMKYGRAQGTFLAWQHVRSLHRIDCVVACSQTIESRMRTHHRIPVRVVQNGIDDCIYTPTTTMERQRLRQRLDLPKNQKVIISVGTLIARKDPETLLRGFLASRACKKGFLIILGSGNLRAACEYLASGHDNIRFVGQVSNVLDYLKAADLFVSASRAEGLPNTVLEALACGLPVCLSNIPEHREILAYDTSVGRTFPVGRHDSLAQVLDECENIDLTAPFQPAADLVRHNFSSRDMAQKYQRLYCELLGESEKYYNYE